MNLTLEREPYRSDATSGRMLLPNGQMLYTIELPWQHNLCDHSCVPEGDYALIPRFSSLHGLVYCLHNPQLNVYAAGAVPDESRSAIEFHAANFVSQLKGCIGVGLDAGLMIDPHSQRPVRAVKDSDAAMVELRRLLGVARHTLTIKEATAMTDLQPLPTIGAAPWYTSQVYIGLAVTVLSQLLALAPSIATRLGLTSLDSITAIVTAFFQVVALIAGVYALVKRQKSTLQPLTSTSAAAATHPATLAAMKAGTRFIFH